MRVVIFTRGNDKVAQKLQCLFYAKFKDYNVIEIVSNTHELSKLVVNAKIDTILMTDPSRLTRDRMEYESIQNMLRGYGVTIELAQ